MKRFFKTIIIGLTYLSVNSLSAQVEVSVSPGLNLEKYKGWRLVKAGRDEATNENYVVYGKPGCDIDQSSSGNVSTNTYNGVNWEIDKLFFDPSFALKRNELTAFGSSLEAMQAGLPVWGNLFMPIDAAGTGITVPRALTPDYIGKIVITGGQVPNKSGYQIIQSQIRSQAQGIEYGGYSAGCNEVPSIAMIASAPLVSTGQMWPMYSSTEHNGGNLLFVTTGVNPDETKHHWVFRKYNQDAVVIKELVLPFDYLMAMNFMDLKLSNGKIDYILVIHPSGYKSKGSKIPFAKDPLSVEYIRIDGESLTIKERFFIKSNYTNWLSETIFEDNGSIYLAGPSSNDTEDLSVCVNSMYASEVEAPMSILRSPKSLPNFQIVKISNGKVDYVSAITTADAVSKLKVAPGKKGNSKPVFSFTGQNVSVKNNKVIFTAQQVVGANDRDAMVTMVINESGKLDGYYVKPESTYSLSNSFFSADGTQLYWAIYDTESYNSLSDELGTMRGKTTNVILYALDIMKIDLVKNEIAAYNSYGAEQYGISYKQPVLYDDPNETVLVSRSLDKKAKDSELMFITIKK